MYTKRLQPHGYTLVEMLVVVSIIGIISTISLAAFSTARENSRDKARKSDVGEIQLAIKLYEQGNRNLPSSGMICDGCGGEVNQAVIDYMGTVEDPRHDGTTYFYEFTGTQVCANRLEQTENPYCEDID